MGSAGSDYVRKHFDWDFLEVTFLEFADCRSIKVSELHSANERLYVLVEVLAVLADGRLFQAVQFGAAYPLFSGLRDRRLGGGVRALLYLEQGRVAKILRV